MESKKAITTDQLNKLKETVRQRFDELYHRIGSNRQNLMNKVLMVDHQIIKEFTKETIDADHEKDILRRVREVERMANNQLPHFHKVAPSPAAPSKPAPVKAATPNKEVKPAKESKPVKEAKTKVSKPKEVKGKTAKKK